MYILNSAMQGKKPFILIDVKKLLGENLEIINKSSPSILRAINSSEVQFCLKMAFIVFTFLCRFRH